MTARLCKRYRPEVLEFWSNLEENLIDIQNHLIWETWRPSRLTEFMTYRPKPRLISAPAFRDRVVHHALVSVIGPLFEQKFICHSYACRIDKGNHTAVRYLRSLLINTGQDAPYAIKADISSYFASIDHDILFSMLKRRLRDKQVIRLCEHIVYDSGYDTVGLPIGALTSQLFANIYLDVFDHYIKDDLGIIPYVRYMDDFIILCQDKKAAHSLLSGISEYLSNRLRLKMNPKTSVFPARHGIDFCGYRVWPDRVFPRRRNVHAAKRRLRMLMSKYSLGECSANDIIECLCSFSGYMKHCEGCKTFGIIEQYITAFLHKHNQNKYSQTS